VQFAGGGGWGNPYERDPERVRMDVVQDYVSPDCAREDYGVALTSELAVDAAATAQLRARTTAA
jgi:N-methylhydantoinase B